MYGKRLCQIKSSYFRKASSCIAPSVKLLRAQTDARFHFVGPRSLPIHGQPLSDTISIEIMVPGFIAHVVNLYEFFCVKVERAFY